jgi:putative transposase
MGVRPSMGTVGDAFDNAMAESFFAGLECELIDRKTFKTRTEARLKVFTWIEGWYNPRRYSALGYLSPINFERRSTSIPESDIHVTSPSTPHRVLGNQVHNRLRKEVNSNSRGIG